MVHSFWVACKLWHKKDRNTLGACSSWHRCLTDLPSCQKSLAPPHLLSLAQEAQSQACSWASFFVYLYCSGLSSHACFFHTDSRSFSCGMRHIGWWCHCYRLLEFFFRSFWNYDNNCRGLWLRREVFLDWEWGWLRFWCSFPCCL